MLMISLLFGFVQSGDTLKWDWVEYSDYSSFYIKFNEHSTTYENHEWFVVFRVHSSSGPSKLIFASGKNHGKAYYDGINLEIKPEIDEKTNYLIVTFNISNNGTEPKRIDVGVFADVKIDKNDKASIHILEGKRGFTMYDNNTNLKYTLLIRDAPGSTNVDTFYYGEMSTGWYGQDATGFYYYPNMFPYFQETFNFNESTYDSCFAFSWKDRDIYPGKSIKLSTTAGVGSDLKTPPFVTLDSEFKEVYDPNESVTIKFSVGDYDENETIFYNFSDSSGASQEYNFTTNQTIKIFDHILPITLRTEKEYWFSISARDSHGFESNVINKSLFVTKKPIVYITNEVNGTYKEDSKINVKGSVFDDTKVKLKYYFDDGFLYDLNDKLYHCYDKNQTFDFTITIPNEISFGNHTLHIYAEDEFGVKSAESNHSITYIRKNKPELRNIALSSKKLQPGETVQITGQVKDLDINDSISIYAGIFEANNFTKSYGSQQIATITSDGDWMNFSGSFKIPDDVNATEHTIYFQAKDSEGSNSDDATLNFTVYIPEKISQPVAKDLPNTPEINSVPSKTESPMDIDLGETKDAEKKKKIAIYVTVPSVLVAVAAVAIISYFMCKHGENQEEESTVEMQETVNRWDENMVTLDNPLFTTTESTLNQDPFADDFEEARVVSYFYATEDENRDVEEDKSDSVNKESEPENHETV